MRRTLIVLVEMVAEMPLLESVCPVFLDSLPTVHQSFRRYKNRVLSVKRSQSGGIAVIECLVKFGALISFIFYGN